MIYVYDPKVCWDIATELRAIAGTKMTIACRDIILKLADDYEHRAWEIVGMSQQKEFQKDVDEERSEGWDYSRLDL